MRVQSDDDDLLESENDGEVRERSTTNNIGRKRMGQRPNTFTKANSQYFNLVDHFDTERPEMIPGSVVIQKPLPQKDGSEPFYSPATRNTHGAHDMSLTDLLDSAFADPKETAQEAKELASTNHLSHADFHAANYERERLSILRARSSASKRFLGDRLDELDDTGVQPWVVVESVLPAIASEWFPSEYSLGQPNPMASSESHRVAFSKKGRDAFEIPQPDPPQSQRKEAPKDDKVNMRKLSFKERMEWKRNNKDKPHPSAATPASPGHKATTSPGSSISKLGNTQTSSFVERPPWMLDAVCQVPGFEPQDFARKISLCVVGHTLVPNDKVPGTSSSPTSTPKVTKDDGDNKSEEEGLVKPAADVFATKRQNQLFNASVARYVGPYENLSGQLMCGTFSKYSQMFSDCAVMQFLDPTSATALKSAKNGGCGNASIVTTDTTSWGSFSPSFATTKEPAEEEERHDITDEETRQLTTLWIGFTEAPHAGFPTVQAVNSLDTEYGRQHVRPGFGCSIGLADVYYVNTVVGTCADRLGSGFKSFLKGLSCARELASMEGVGSDAYYKFLPHRETLQEEEALDITPVSVGGRARAHRLPDQVSIPIRSLLTWDALKSCSPDGQNRMTKAEEFEFVSYMPQVVWLSTAYKVCQQMIQEAEEEKEKSQVSKKVVRLRSNVTDLFGSSCSSSPKVNFSPHAHLRRKHLEHWVKGSPQSERSLEDEVCRRCIDAFVGGLATPHQQNSQLVDWKSCAFLHGETFSTLTAVHRWEAWLKCPASTSPSDGLKARRVVADALMKACSPLE